MHGRLGLCPASRASQAKAFFMLAVHMLPPIIITIPLFPAVNALGLNDTHILLVLLYAAFYVSIATWIMRAHASHRENSTHETP